MNTIKKTLMALTTALALYSCGTDKMPQEKDYADRVGHIQCGSVDALIFSGSDGKAYAINGFDYGYIAVDTNATHQIYSGRGGSAVVMNDKMVELATRIKNDQAKLNYLIDSAWCAKNN